MIDLKVTKKFFDKAIVASAVDKMTNRALSKIGAFVRTAARSLIRSGAGTSNPGQPPKSHVGLLRDHIYFNYEPSIKTVVIGPAALKTRSSMGDAVPHTLEFGGRVRRKTKRGVVKERQYAPRPYMRPALARAQADMARKAPELWKLIGPGSGFSQSLG